jgi:ubiquinone/menaquinone biosynthesis C-methylase UbiE
MKKYKFLDVGCKIGGSFDVSKRFGYSRDEGIGIDINEESVNKFKDSGYNAVVADATNLPFEDNSFELVIFSHVLEHLPNEELGKKALDECLRVSTKYVFLALPFFDEDEYLNSLGLKTYYSDWAGHKNMVHLKTITEKYLSGYQYDLKLKTKLIDSNSSEIHPLSSPTNSHKYDESIHGSKEFIVFDREIWREYEIVIKL